MKFHWKSLVSMTLFIPFFFRIKYMLGAWQYSPLDSKDYFFWLIAGAAFIIFLFWGYKNSEKLDSRPDYYGLLMLAVSIVVIIFSIVKDINTVYLAGSLMFIAGGCWLLWGWRVLWVLLPVFFICILGLPSTSYWMTFLFRDIIQNVSGFMIKLALTGIALIWFSICLWCPRKTCIRPEKFFFCLALTAYIFSYVESSTPAPQGAPIYLKMELAKGSWLGEKLKLSPLDDTFQEQNKISRYIHYSKSNVCVSTLVIELRNDLHQIHPAALCLSTGNWEIISNSQVKIKTRNGLLSAARILAIRNGQKALFFTWFTNDIFSTGSFIFFRKTWNFNTFWHIYQVTTPVIENDTNTENILLDFINTFEYVKTPESSDKVK